MLEFIVVVALFAPDRNAVANATTAITTTATISKYSISPCPCSRFLWIMSIASFCSFKKIYILGLINRPFPFLGKKYARFPEYLKYCG